MGKLRRQRIRVFTSAGRKQQFGHVKRAKKGEELWNTNQQADKKGEDPEGKEYNRFRHSS